MKAEATQSVIRAYDGKEAEPVRWYAVTGLVFFVCLLQTSIFYATYKLYHIIQYPYYLDLETWMDHAIPYMSWTYVIYYFGFFYIAIWGAAGIWNMPRWMVRRTITVYIGLVLAGGVLHLLIPSDSPWPLIKDLSAAQVAFKTSVNVEPLAGFPSMHVAMATLPAFISLYVFRSAILRTASVILASLVSISIVTAKEHWAIDVPGGLVLGLAAGWIWLRYAWRDRVERQPKPAAVSAEIETTARR